MPIHELRWRACAHRCKALLKRRDEAAPKYPKCGASQSEKSLSVFAVTGGGRQASPVVCASADRACRRH